MFCSLIIWAALWEIFGRTGASFITPPLSTIFLRIVEIVPTASFAEALWITGKAFLLGNLVAVSVGVPLGVLMGRSVIADRILRSEEHTSELQSLMRISYAVFCLKKKKQ